MADQKKSDVEILEDDEEIITLYDDNDNPVDFYQIACVEYEDEFYTVLQPAQDLPGVEEDEAVIFKIVEENDETDLFLPVESEELMDKIFNKYLEAVADKQDKE